MKKLVSLTLAAAMVMSLASVAFAAEPINLVIGTNPYKESSNATNGPIDDAKPDTVDMVGYGSKVLYPIQKVAKSSGDPAGMFALTDADAKSFNDYEEAKKLKMKDSWEQNEDLVKDSYVAKKKIKGTNDYGYFVVIETNSASTTSKKDIIGSIKFSGSGITFGGNNIKEVKLPVAITMGYNDIVGNGGAAKESSVELPDDDEYIFKFGTDDSKKLAEDEEFDIKLYGSEGRFVVDTFGQGSILVGNSVKYNEGFEKKIPDANYVYVNGNGAVFNKIGWLYLNAIPTDVIYQVVNDKFVKVNAEYDTVEEAYVLKTRTLGKYVIAEKELDLEVVNAEVVEEGTEGPVVEVPGVEVPKIENPGTGAAC